MLKKKEIRQGMENYEIELALTTFPNGDLKELSKLLPDGYIIEERSSNGWGVVVSSNSENKLESLNDQVKKFLSGVLPIRKWIELSSPVLRIAVFNKSFTCTISLDDFELLTLLKIKLEISIYPTE